MSIEMFTPAVTFKTRASIDENPGFEWRDLTTREMFENRRVVLFALPGAFTPTCSSTHLPGYEAHYQDLLDQEIDEVYCLSVNDSFTMNAWFDHLGIESVKPVPDGSGDFTRQMGMLVRKDNLGFGERSWRYSMVVNNGLVETIFVEKGRGDNVDGDPFEISDVNTMLHYLKGVVEQVRSARAAV